MTDDLDTYVTCDMIKHTQVYVDLCRALQKKAEQVWIEERVHIREDMFGTVDFAALFDKGELIHIVDLKYGKGVAVYPDTKQAKYYGLGILNALNEKILKKLKTIRVTIVQPRINNTNTQDFSIKELRKFEVELLAAADRVDNSTQALEEGRFEDVELQAGSHCGFCKARYRCRELYEFVVKKGPMKDSWLGFAKAQHSGVKRNEFIRDQLGLLSKEELEEYMEWSDLATRTGYAIKDKLTTLAAGGEEFKTLKLVAGRTTRHWKDQRAVEKFLKKSNVPAYTEKLISPAQAEKQIDVPEELIQKTPGKPALVSRSDRRKELTNNTAEVDAMFDEL